MKWKFSDERVEGLMHELMAFDEVALYPASLDDPLLNLGSGKEWIVSKDEQKAMQIVIEMLADCKRVSTKGIK